MLKARVNIIWDEINDALRDIYQEQEKPMPDAQKVLGLRKKVMELAKEYSSLTNNLT